MSTSSSADESVKGLASGNRLGSAIDNSHSSSQDNNKPPAISQQPQHRTQPPPTRDQSWEYAKTDNNNIPRSVNDNQIMPEDPACKQLFFRLSQELNEKKPRNPIYFIVDMLCRQYPDQLGGFAAIWNDDPQLEKERLMVIEFFKFNNISTDVASHFTRAGFDTLETLCTMTDKDLHSIQTFSNVKWLPGHEVRIQQVFADIAGRVKAYRIEREKLLQMARLSSGITGHGHCDHPLVYTRMNLTGGRGHEKAELSYPSPLYRHPFMNKYQTSHY